MNNARAWLLVVALVALGVLAASDATAPSARAGNGDSSWVQGPGNMTPFAQGYQIDNQKGPYRSGLNAVDSAQITSALLTSTQRFTVNGRPTITVSLRFSASGQSAGIYFVRTHAQPDNTEQILGISQITTVTETLLRKDDAGKFMTPDVLFDTGGATHGRVLLEGAPGAGTVDMWVGSN